MSINRRHFLQGTLAVAALTNAGCAAQMGSSSSYLTPILKPELNNTVFHWIDIALQQTRDQRIAPPRAAYNFALATTAGFLAANGVKRQYGERFGVGSAPAGVDPEIAYGIAFAKAAAEAFQQPFVFEQSVFLKQFSDGHAKTVSIAWGEAVARHIIQQRTDDGSEPSESNFYFDRYQRRDDVLRWSPTGPFYSAKPGPAFSSYARPLFPGHGAIKPWTMSSGKQFRAPDFYDPASPEFAKEFHLVKHIGGKDSKHRTSDQEEIALFWEDGPWGLTPPGHYLLVAIQVLQNRKLSFIELARTFALLGMVQGDASISAWDSKYAHDVLRPETAIRDRAAKFQNSDPRVQASSKWQSFIPTPEFPSYTSGHSTFGAAAAKLIALVYGRDRVSFSHESPDQVIWPQIKNKRRHWTSLSKCAEENGMSRIYGGVHWMMDHKHGMKAGENIAKQAFYHTFPKRAG